VTLCISPWCFDCLANQTSLYYISCVSYNEWSIQNSDWYWKEYRFSGFYDIEPFWRSNSILSIGSSASTRHIDFFNLPVEALCLWSSTQPFYEQLFLFLSLFMTCVPASCWCITWAVLHNYTALHTPFNPLSALWGSSETLTVSLSTVPRMMKPVCRTIREI